METNDLLTFAGSTSTLGREIRLISGDAEGNSALLAAAERIHRTLCPNMPPDYCAHMRDMFAEGAEMVALVVDQSVKGICVYRSCHTTFHGHRFCISDLVVDEAARGSGLGTGLLTWCEERARERGCDHLDLESGVRRPRAHKFYFQHGFHIFAFAFTTKPVDGSTVGGSRSTDRSGLSPRTDRGISSIDLPPSGNSEGANSIEIIPVSSDPDLRQDWLTMSESLHREFRPAIPADYRSYIHRMLDEGAELAVLISEASVKALCIYRFQRTTFHGRRLYIDDLVTDEGSRGRGLGALLMEWCQQRAREGGCETLDLESGVQRSRTHRFYFREGLTIYAYGFTKPLLREGRPCEVELSARSPSLLP